MIFKTLPELFAPLMSDDTLDRMKAATQPAASAVGCPPLIDDILDRLMAELHHRVSELPEGSYTTKLLEGGLSKIGSKILEEANEVIEAAGEPGEAGFQHTVREACDVIFHLWVLLASRGISVDSLRRELERREGVSGLEEKRRRGQERAS